MKYKKITAYPLGWTWPIYITFLEELKRRSYFDCATIVAFNAKIDKELKSRLNGDGVISHHYFANDAIPSIRDPALKRLEKGYGIPNLGLLGILEHRERDSRLGLVDYFYFWEDYLSKEKPDLVIMQHPATLISIALFLVAISREIQIIIPTNARIPGRAILRDGKYFNTLFDLWPGLQERYNSLKKNGLTDEQRKTQSKKLQKIHEHKPKPIWFTVKPKKLSIRLVGLLSSLSLSKLKRSFLLRWRKKFHHFGKENVPNTPYVFFPLHYEPEVALDLLAPFFRHQYPLIEYIRQSLPVRVKLVVKEHPAMAGRRPQKFYQDIEALHSTVLLKTNVDSYNIIGNDNCKGVVTISSTAGFEAMIMGKPVVTFGNSFYNVADDLVLNVTDLTTLPEVLLDIGSRNNGHDKEENLLCFLQALDEMTFEGLIASGDHVNRSLLFTPENINAIADEFEKRFPAT